MRSPLRSIIGFSKIINEDFGNKLDNEIKDYFNRITRSGEKMNELIDDMLSLLKITQQEMNYADIDISFLVDSILTKLRESDPERKISIIVEDGLHIKADQKLFKIALQNLLRNALKSTSKKQDPKIEFGYYKRKIKKSILSEKMEQDSTCDKSKSFLNHLNALILKVSFQEQE